MRQILFLAIAAMVIAGVMPHVMGAVGKTPEAQPAKAVQQAPAQANHRTFTVRGDARGHFQVEGSVDGLEACSEQRVGAAPLEQATHFEVYSVRRDC